MNTKEAELAAIFLKQYSDYLGSQCCNTEQITNQFTLDERLEFHKKYHEYNGDPEEYDEEWLRKTGAEINGEMMVYYLARQREVINNLCLEIMSDPELEEWVNAEMAALDNI